MKPQRENKVEEVYLSGRNEEQEEWIDQESREEKD